MNPSTKIYNKLSHFKSVDYNILFLGLIIFTAFLLRIWGIWNISNQDEYNEVFEALRVCSGNLNYERWAKRFYLYVLSIAYGFYYVIGWVVQIFESPIDFATKAVRNLEPLLVIGRFISAAFGTGSVLLTFFIGRSLFSSTVGIIAAVFLCLNPLNVQVSHFATVDASLCFNILLSFYFITKLNSKRDGHWRYYILAGLFSGIAFQNKAPAIILLVPFIVSHAFKYEGKDIVRSFFCKEICYYGLSYILGLIIGNPAILFAPHKFLMSLIGYTSVYTTAINIVPSKSIGYVTYLSFFYYELGFIFCALAIYSLIKSIFSKDKAEILILSFIIPFYLVVGGSRFMVFSRYMVPLMPFLFILCSRYLVQIFQNLKSEPKISKSVLVIFCVILLAQPVWRLIKFERLVSGKDTKIIAKEWVEENIPFGSKILIDTGKSFNTIGPKINGNKQSIMRVHDQQKEAIQKNDRKRTSGKVDKNSLIYYDLLMKTVPENSYDITSTNNGLEVKNIEYYISKKFEYLIIVKSIKDRNLKESFRKHNPGMTKFYQSLDDNKKLKLIKKIKPSVNNRGHTYLIYKLILDT